MDGNDVSADYVIAELIDMGFEFSVAVEAIEAVGPCIQDAVEFILKGSCKKNTNENVSHGQSSRAYTCSTGQDYPSGKRAMPSHSLDRMNQSSITGHLQSLGRPKRRKSGCASDASTSGFESPRVIKEEAHVPLVKSEVSLQGNDNLQFQHFSPVYSSPIQEIESDWEQKVNIVLHKHFGFSSLKSFQKEALEAWLANRDCLVLAATGSGKSLCFQIPALLTGKVVVVISPLISLMHDQCLKLAKHGVSACFLGSGQTDSSVEHKAMSGTYGVVYVCPETVLRLIEPLQRLAESRGIALFAIDEVHCVSKWGHDFRPDYRKLSVLRESFKACNLKFLKFNIPLMALTATATIHVREDILKSLHMSKETKIVLTSFFRPNLRFSVKHSRTSCTSSYEKDFCELINTYTTRIMVGRKESATSLHDSGNESDSSSTSNCSISEVDEIPPGGHENFDNDHNNGNGTELSSGNENGKISSRENQLSVEYLEDEFDTWQGVDDLDVDCGEFYGQSPTVNGDFCGASETPDPSIKTDEGLGVIQGPLGWGATIIYVPTRKETIRVAEFLSRFGVKAAAYHAKVVVATIAFGMGIDKSNVRRIIHYGWPQSLEAYYQEAGRAGRDGKLADCTLYADLTKIPTLLPSQRSEEQTKHAYKMLSDCFRYGMATACCRAKRLVKYFGEDLHQDKCLLCDICVAGPPKLQNMKDEANIFMRVITANCEPPTHEKSSYDNAICKEFKRRRLMEKPNFKMVVTRIREQFQKFAATDRLWWQGLSRILEDKGYIREGDDMIRVSIKYPEPTDLGLRFLCSESEQTLYAHPEADMLLSIQNPKPYSSFSEWGRGWADPEIRRQRLQGKKGRKRRRKRYSNKHHSDPKTVRGRITAKLSKQKH
ncbi:RECQ helicase SIM isoform X2 [Tasmannia lanceolata]|uniref:RECQ helicase SIM isoform X2 n=1 Tax=Tasmannia lanceolata TaxID=3420 RepID=UPI00406412AA